jgi:hypothetical protein
LVLSTDRGVLRAGYPNLPNGTVSIAKCLILWDCEIHQIAGFSPKAKCLVAKRTKRYAQETATFGTFR